MEKEYIATWRHRASRCGAICTTVVRVFYPPHEEPKGAVLKRMVVEDVNRQSAWSKSEDEVHIYSIIELQNPVWCIGQTREMLVDGRPAQLEATANGWRIHI